MKTIYQKIQEAVKKNCADVHYEESYPKDYVKLNHTDDELLEDESIDTMTPLVHAMQVILDVIKQEATTFLVRRLGESPLAMVAKSQSLKNKTQ